MTAKDTPVDNEPGRAFYIAQGFREDYRMSRYYSDERDGVTYVKFLRSAVPTRLAWR